MMQKRDQILDAFLEQKVQEFVPPFEEAQWQHALARLEEDDKKQPLAWFKALGVVLAIALIGAGGYAWLGKGKQTETLAAQNAKPAVAPVQQSAVSTAATTSENTSAETTTEPATTDPSVANDNVTPVAQTRNNSACNAVSYAAPSKSNKAHNADIASTRDDEQNVSETTTAVSPSSSTPTNVASDVVRKEPKAPKQSIAKTKTTIPKVSKESTAKVSKAQDDPRSTQAKGNADAISVATSIPQEEKPIAQNNTAATARMEKPTENTSGSSTTAPKETYTVVSNKNETSKPKEIVVPGIAPTEVAHTSAKQETPKASETKPAEETTTKAKDKSTKAKHWLLMPSIIAGASYQQAPKDIITNEINTAFAPQIGLQWRWKANNKLGVHFGSSLSMANNLSFSLWTNGSGPRPSMDSSNYIRRDQRLLQLFVPLSIAYSPSALHTMIGGINYMQPLYSQYGVKDYGATSFTNSWGKTQQNYSPMVYGTVGYEYALLTNLRIYAHYLYGFTDFTNDAVQGVQVYDRNSRMNMGMQWQIGK
jgi:hypothetical protein